MNVIIDQHGKRVDHLISQATYIWEPPHAMNVWTISHKLGKYPSVVCVESTGNVIYGSIKYIDFDSLSITFIVSITGKAYLN